jgi:flagellar L-ring protein FlgH
MRLSNAPAPWGTEKKDKGLLHRTPNAGRRTPIRPILSAGLLLMATGFMGLACTATAPEFKKERTNSYVSAARVPEPRGSGSIYREAAGLFEDRKARAINDLVTINIIENSSATKKADTATGRTSNMDANISNLFGGTLHYDLENLFGKSSGLSGTLMPTVISNYKNDFAGAGNTTRQGSLIATIQARIVDVLPNGNFLIESRKDITVNREKQVLLLRGVIRPDDIAADNSVPSSHVADAEMIYSGEGVVGDKQGQNWMVRFLDWAWPF